MLLPIDRGGRVGDAALFDRRRTLAVGKVRPTDVMAAAGGYLELSGERLRRVAVRPDRRKTLERRLDQPVDSRRRTLQPSACILCAPIASAHYGVPVWAEDFAADHVAAFNHSVETRDFTNFLTRFDDDALMRFENVPGADFIEFAGLRAIAGGYEEHPPDDKIRIAGPVGDEGGVLTIPFRWLSNDEAGVLRLTLRAGRILRMVVTFG